MSSVTRRSSADDSKCKRCATALDDTNRITLKPCEHGICIHCMVEIQAMRGSSQLKCPCCEQAVVRHAWIPKKNGNKTQVRHPYTAPTGEKPQLHPTHDAFRVFMHTTFSGLTAEERQNIIGKGLLFNALYHIRVSPKDPERPHVVLVQSRNISAQGERLPSVLDQQALLWTLQLFAVALRPLPSLKNVPENANENEEPPQQAAASASSMTAEQQQVEASNEATTNDFLTLCRYFVNMLT